MALRSGLILGYSDPGKFVVALVGSVSTPTCLPPVQETRAAAAMNSPRIKRDFRGVVINYSVNICKISDA